MKFFLATVLALPSVLGDGIQFRCDDLNVESKNGIGKRCHKRSNL